MGEEIGRRRGRVRKGWEERGEKREEKKEG